ncbi:MIP/aquaporin family protein [Paenarthrobacter sp. NPDC092416]|uniref:MIP/aquaporin family protein n=1 Tax=Paenarthrobacter sp. NPDC092416 TaxID=3364386 RepID=UPI00382A930D
MTSSVQVTTEREPGLIARLSAELLGTMFLVLVATGVAIFRVPQTDALPPALAAGLAVTAAMLAFGYVSGGHFNPIITLGNLIAGRVRPVAAAAYVAAQLVGAGIGAALIYFVLRTLPGFTDIRTAFDTVAPGFGEHSMVQAPLAGVLLVEVVGSAMLVAVFLGSTAGRRAVPAMAPFAVGLTLAVLLQLGQSLGNIPFNPARATAQAFFSSPWALEGLWLFWVAPLVGAALAGFVYRGFSDATTSNAVPDDADSHDDGDYHLDADDTEDDDFDVEEDARAVKHDGDRKPAASPAAGGDDARDFFDGKKG